MKSAVSILPVIKAMISGDITAVKRRSRISLQDYMSQTKATMDLAHPAVS